MEQLRLTPLFLRLCGLPRILRGAAMADAMEKHHPQEGHFYLAFIATAPRLQGMGLGGALLNATLKRVDEQGTPAYLENSNPRNRALRTPQLIARRNIAPAGAPPLIPMWRKARGI